MSEEINAVEQNNTQKRVNPKGKYNEVYDWISSMVITIFVIILVFTFVARLVGVQGSSMESTLQNGDRLILTNLFYKPSVGDIVVVSRDYLDGSSSEEPIIKRVVALGGQTVDFKPDEIGYYHVYVDGQLASEETIREPMLGYTDSIKFPYTVPEGCTFVMGDNRNNSKDSRDPELKAVDNRYILGHVVFRLFPIKKAGAVK